MKIKMLKTRSGPDSENNFNEGQKREVCEEEARYWKNLGYCELLEPYPSESQKAVVAPPEKAVVKPTETAQIKVSPEPVKAPVKPPAASGNAVASAKAVTWGSPEVKK